MFNLFSFKSKRQRAIENIEHNRRLVLEHRFSLGRTLLRAWEAKIFSDKYLSTYDRYTLEFIFEMNNRWSKDGVYFNLRIYNQNLDVVYNFNTRFYDIPDGDTKVMNQRKQELEYWLSLDWEIDDEQSNK